MTGRLSASTPTSSSYLVGSTIRDLFVAGDGHVLIVADYDQIELRCAAFLSQDPEMIRVFRLGQDIHALAAAVMLQIDIDKVYRGPTAGWQDPELRHLVRRWRGEDRSGGRCVQAQGGGVHP